MTLLSRLSALFRPKTQENASGSRLIERFAEVAKTDGPMLDIMMHEIYREMTDGRSGFVMFDGGAHKGWHTIRMLQTPGCEAVWSVEADPSIGDVLQANLTKWHTEPTPKLHLVRKALQDDATITSIPWMSSHSHVGRSSIKATNADAPTIWTTHEDVQYRDETHVEATTIDAIFDGETRDLPFIKLDLEGADILALRGASQTLRTKRPVIAYENASKGPDVHGYTVQDIADFFDAHDYVPLNYVGEPMQIDTWFDFYEAWAVPKEQMAVIQPMIQRAVARRMTQAQG